MSTEVQAVAAEVADRLRRRGIDVDDGDLMVDDLNSSEPDDPHFVLPPRMPGEPIPRYVARIDESTARLRDHPNISP
jgi:hypothetical protein